MFIKQALPFLIGVEKSSFALPALRTVQEIIPHTALKLIVSSSGLDSRFMGLSHCKKPILSKKGVWPLQMVG